VPEKCHPDSKEKVILPDNMLVPDVELHQQSCFVPSQVYVCVNTDTLSVLLSRTRQCKNESALGPGPVEMNQTVMSQNPLAICLYIRIKYLYKVAKAAKKVLVKKIGQRCFNVW
jgi:hypothetical protein